jgi:hypothetical protein
MFAVPTSPIISRLLSLMFRLTAKITPAHSRTDQPLLIFKRHWTSLLALIMPTPSMIVQFTSRILLTTLYKTIPSLVQGHGRGLQSIHNVRVTNPPAVLISVSHHHPAVHPHPHRHLLLRSPLVHYNHQVSQSLLHNNRHYLLCFHLQAPALSPFIHLYHQQQVP